MKQQTIPALLLCIQVHLHKDTWWKRRQLIPLITMIRREGIYVCPNLAFAILNIGSYQILTYYLSEIFPEYSHVACFPFRTTLDSVEEDWELTKGNLEVPPVGDPSSKCREFG